MSKHWPVMLICGPAVYAACDASWSKQLRPNRVVVETSNDLWPSFPLFKALSWKLPTADVSVLESDDF